MREAMVPMAEMAGDASAEALDPATRVVTVEARVNAGVRVDVVAVLERAGVKGEEVAAAVEVAVMVLALGGTVASDRTSPPARRAPHRLYSRCHVGTQRQSSTSRV